MTRPPRPSPSAARLAPRRLAFFTALGLFGAPNRAAAQAAPQSPARACADAALYGQTMRDTGKLVEARARFVQCAQSSCPPMIQKDCADWQRDVDARLPSIVVTPKDDAGSDVLHFSLSLDGAPLAAVAGRAVAVDPGQHKLDVSAKGHKLRSLTFVAREGQRAQPVAVVLERLGKPGTSTSSSSPSAEGPPDATKPAETPGRPIALPLVLAGAGVAGAVTFGVLFAGVKSDRDSVVGTPAYTQDKRDELQSRVIVADVILGVSVAALVASGVLYLIGQPPAAGGSARGLSLRF